MVASVALLAIWARPSSAAVDFRWAGGAQFTVVFTRFASAISNESMPGLEGGLLRRVAAPVWLGLEGGWIDHGDPGVAYEDDVSDRPLDREFSSVHVAAVAAVGPSWAFRPYVVSGLSVSRMTGTRTGDPDVHEDAWGFELGAGVRGGDQLLPWLEWRWHRSLSRMRILGEAPLDYHTLGIGLGWN